MTKNIKYTIENKLFNMAPVEIIVPFHDEISSVAKLMESVFNTVHSNRYLITLVDDGSTNSSFIQQIEKKNIPGVRCLKQEHKGFGAAVNLALKNPFSSQITWVMIMQSDVFAEDNKWLYNMGETLNSLKDYGIKMVAPLTNNPMVDDDRLYGKKGEKKEDYVLKEGFLPMYCVMSHRELFKRVGFLKEYPYAGVEAEEYAYRMRAMGYKQAICGSSWVNHVGGATLSRFENNTKVQEILQKARDEFGLPLKKEVVGG